MNLSQYSGRTLAFLGDAVWSLAVRNSLLRAGQGQGKILQKKSILYVSAKAQARFYEQLHEEGFFSAEEEDWYRLGRNNHGGSVPKNTDVQTYRMSTGFEAILGALYLLGNENRIRQIWDKVRTF
ncbi:Mini-ribonuclease 3 [Bulleidia sp. zg-1006]|uniref:Mini-ribonuclease 3 n=1 Tax=Bacillati TaxID=1783272 RepID=UPI00193A475D|nr:ribonuclease III domain-containing protein [Bulleidia sp. zg-1006]MBW9212450.1 ribonuclease III [Trueperella sp. zg.1013]QRG86793.1 Mini-ribonuclease 3 [Bulleidia sp. zg-1006]